MVTNNQDREAFVARAVRIVQDGNLREIPTVSSTGTNLIAVCSLVPEQGTFLFLAGTTTDIRRNFEQLWDAGFKFDYTGIGRTCSLHQNKLKVAFGVLAKALQKRSMELQDKVEIIGNMGIALNLQIDLDPLWNVRTDVRDDINQKLSALGLEVVDIELFKKHSRLNPFYNATKHARQEANRKHIDALNGPEGVKIAIDYRETIVRILRWYYEKTTGKVPQWPELAAIDYSPILVGCQYSTQD